MASVESVMRQLYLLHRFHYRNDGGGGNNGCKRLKKGGRNLKISIPHSLLTIAYFLGISS